MAVWDGTHVGVIYARWNGGSFGVSEARFALLNPDGSVVSDTALTDYKAAQSYAGVISPPQLVWNGSEYAAVWVENSPAQLTFVRFDANGTVKGPRVTVGTRNYLPTASSISYGMLAWSDCDKTYAVTFGSISSLVFRRIGVDASVLDAPVVVLDGRSFSLNPQTQLRAAPDGTWVVGQASCGSVYLAAVDTSGSMPGSPVYLGGSSCDIGGWPAVVHGGDDWITTWVGAMRNQIHVNRGTTLNYPKKLVTGSALSIYGDVNMVMSGASLAVAWTEEGGSADFHFNYRLQRFRLTTTLSDAPIPIHGVVDILPTKDITETQDVSLVATTGGNLLAVWADPHNGGERNIYAAPIDVHNCF